MKSIKRTRIAYLIIGMIAMLFLGMIYAWSNFTSASRAAPRTARTRRTRCASPATPAFP